MISKQLAEALNSQMNNEFDAAHAYMAMAAYCEHHDYGGFAHFYLQQAEEERYHGQKIYDYLNDRGIHAIFTSTSEPKITFDSVLDTFNVALDQEKAVTKNIYDLTDLAVTDKEHATVSFLNWFLDEQVEEEATFDTHIQYLTRISKDKSALFLYEKELGKREFTTES